VANQTDEILLRRLCAEILVETTRRQEFSNIILKEVLDKYNYLEGNKKAFIKKLSMGCLERKIQLDYIIDLYSKTPVKKMKPVVLAILETGVYQILFMDQVYDTTACNAAVSLAKKKGLANLSGFINAVLRKVCAEKEHIPYPDKEKDFTGYLSVYYSMPSWIVEQWITQYGAARAEEMLSGLMAETKVFLRIKESLSEGEKEALKEKWRNAGVTVTESALLPYACEVKGTDRISSLAGFEEGLFTVQDLSSMLVCECAGIKAGDHIIDVCAAPGGKTLHAAEKLQGSGRVDSFDLTEHKVERIRENIARMGYENVFCDVKDATVFYEELENTADVLLADVPCSGMGVMGRKQDIRYNLSKEQTEELVKLQQQILTNVSRYVKPGGRMVFSTCTINRKENDENGKWIEENLPFTRADIGEYLPKGLEEYCHDGMLQLYRGKISCDGFFIAVFEKNR